VSASEKWSGEGVITFVGPLFMVPSLLRHQVSVAANERAFEYKQGFLHSTSESPPPAVRPEEAMGAWLWEHGGQYAQCLGQNTRRRVRNGL
jgi:hypothetical protein